MSTPYEVRNLRAYKSDSYFSDINKYEQVHL